jgi:hypothetical protein
VGKVQAHQMRLFTLKMLKKIFKSYFTTTGSSGARLGDVQAHQMRQFSLNMLQFLFKSELFFITMDSSRALTKAVRVCYSRQFRWAYEGSAGGG